MAAKPKKQLSMDMTVKQMVRALATGDVEISRTMRVGANVAIFAKNWTGCIYSTIEACRKEGVHVSVGMAQRILGHPRFIVALREERTRAGEEGIWTVKDLQAFWTRVSAGTEIVGFEYTSIREEVKPEDADYDQSTGGVQWREVLRSVPQYPSIADRNRAADMLAKTHGAYLDRVEVTGDLKISVTDLLDDDLGHAKRVIDLKPSTVALESEQKPTPVNTESLLD